MQNCKHCNSKASGKYCSNCGSAIQIQRIDRRYIFGEISSVLNLEKGIFYTIKEVLLRPGVTVKKFIDGDRKRLVKPIIFLIVCSLIYTIGKQFLSYDTSYIIFDFEDEERTPLVVRTFDWFSTNYGYANILMAFFIAMWIKVFFRKYAYNYYEIYILLCFTMGVSVLIYPILGIIESITDFAILKLGIFLASIYCGWAIGQFFDGKKKVNYLLGFLSYLLGLVSSIVVLVILGVVVERLFK